MCRLSPPVHRQCLGRGDSWSIFAAIFAAALLFAPAVSRAADVLTAPSPPPATAAVVVPELYDPTRWEVRFGGFAHDALTLPIVEQIAPRLNAVEKYIVLAAEDRMPETKLPVLCYETLLAQEDERDLAWPRFDENSASTICFTSGTTGNPKGVVYSTAPPCCRPCSPVRSTSCPAIRAACAKS